MAQSDGSETERILDALRKQGDEAVWMAAAAKVRAFPFARAMLAASFASPLLEKLQHRNIYIHFWCDSRSGKTGTLKYSISVWGNPRVLVSKYYSTIVGMERFSGTLKHLPFALDELQTLNQKRMTVNDVVYTIGNGAGKARGCVGSGIQHVEEWNNCIISTGEQPMSSDSSMDGVNTRLMELNAVPVPDEGLAQELHRVSERNYGFAGEKFICWLVMHLDRLHEEFYGRRLGVYHRLGRLQQGEILRTYRISGSHARLRSDREQQSLCNRQGNEQSSGGGWVLQSQIRQGIPRARFHRDLHRLRGKAQVADQQTGKGCAYESVRAEPVHRRFGGSG